MKKKLALIMTMSLLLTSVSPVNAAGTEVIEIAEEENLSASFTPTLHPYVFPRSSGRFTLEYVKK